MTSWLVSRQPVVEEGTAGQKLTAGSADTVQESRIEELRDTHRMEQASSTAMIESLRDQVAKNETSLSSQASTALQVAQLRADLAASQAQHKEADEKLTKAVNLLKTVRTKLVTVQRDREDVSKTLDEEKRERTKLVDTLEKLRAEKEREVQSLRQAYEKETQGLKEKAARESLAEKRKWELEIITTKVSHPSISFIRCLITQIFATGNACQRFG